MLQNHPGYSLANHKPIPMMPAAIPVNPFRASYVAYFAYYATHDPFQGQCTPAMAPYDMSLQNNTGTFSPDALLWLVVGT